MRPKPLPEEAEERQLQDTLARRLELFVLVRTSGIVVSSFISDYVAEFVNSGGSAIE